jgi:mRNA-degrading endonuclease toxin of MazEF toxin-antitoxin module
VVSANPAWADVWIVDGGGAKRPALVLTRPEAVDRLERILVALATTNIRGLPSEVRAGPDEGLSLECAFNLDAPELLSRSRFVSFVSEFPQQRWPEVCGAMQRAINC